MITAAIVQARFGSSRFPAKVLKRLGEKTILNEVLTRCRAIRGIDSVVCAVPDEEASAPIEEDARLAGAIVFRGSELDVLARYAGAARIVDADTVLRVTSDCPLIDPEVCAAVIALRAHQNADYASNNLERSFPHGLDCEAFTAAALFEADRVAVNRYDREHVTPWIRRASHLKQVNLLSSDLTLAGERWTLDYPEDFQFMEALHEVANGTLPISMGAVLKLLDRHPELRLINLRHNNFIKEHIK